MSTRVHLDKDVLAQRLADRRAELRLEQIEVAERAGLSRAYISRLESGLVANPKLFDVQRVADALDLSLTALVSPTPSGREIRITEAADIVEQLADEPPEVVDTILSWWRQSLEIHRQSRLARAN